MPAPNTVNYNSPLYGGLSDADKAIWRHIRDQGGYWSAAELATAIGTGTSIKAIGGRLRVMASLGHLVVGKSEPVKTYGVTAACVPPLRETMTPREPQPLGDSHATA